MILIEKEAIMDMRAAGKQYKGIKRIRAASHIGGSAH